MSIDKNYATKHCWKDIPQVLTLDFFLHDNVNKSTIYFFFAIYISGILIFTQTFLTCLSLEKYDKRQNENTISPKKDKVKT